jgi:hypothetical protein
MKYMSKTIWKNAAFLYMLLYTAATILNSVIYLAQGIRNDPSGNWHEIDRAIIVFIVVLAFELCRHLRLNPSWLWYIIAYIPSQLLAFGYVWLAGHRGEDLAATAYRDIWINFTAGYIVLCIISLLLKTILKKNQRQNQR